MKIKKLPALLCVLAIMLSIFPFASAAQSETNEMSEDYRAFALVKALGIYDELPEDTQQPITREQFAVMALKFTGNREGISGDVSYTDVETNRASYADLAAADALGIISGYSDNTFRPDASISGIEATVMVLNAAGYEKRAQSMGAYPANYAMLSTETGLASKAGVNSKAMLNFEDAVKLLYHGLFIPVFQQVSFGDTIEYGESSKKNILAEFHDVYLLSGKMTATPVSGIGTAKTGKDFVQINKNKIRTRDKANYHMLGYNVDCYYRDNINSTPEVVCIFKNKHTVEKTFDLADSLTFSNSAITHIDEESGKKQTYKLSSKHELLYNGVYTTNYGTDLFKDKMGWVTLVSREGNNVYDLICVDEYTNYMQSSFKYINGKLVFSPKYNMTPLSYNLQDDIVIEAIDSTGAQIDPVKLAANNLNDTVMSVFADKMKTVDGKRVVAENATYIKFVAMAETFTGKLEAMGTDEPELIIDGTAYEYSKVNYFDEQYVALGKEYAFLTDVSGRIASTEIDTKRFSDYEYGFLINASEPAGLSDEMELKVLTSDGEIQVIKLAKEVSLNNSKKSKAAIYSSLKTSAAYLPDETGVRQVIKYKLNGKGEIFELITIQQAVGKPDGADENALVRERERRVWLSRGESFNSLGTGTWTYDIVEAGYVMYAQPRIYFNVPQVDRGKDEDYGLFSPESMKDYTVDLYDVDITRRPKVGVRYATAQEGALGRGVVIGLDRVRDDDGYPMTVLRVNTGLSVQEFKGADDTVFAGLNRGDMIVLYGVKVNGETTINYVDRKVDVNNIKDISQPHTPNNEEEKYRVFELYVNDGRNLVLQDGPVIDSYGAREYQKVFYWSPYTQTLEGALLVDASDPAKDKVEVRAAEFTDLKPSYSYGANEASIVLAYEVQSVPKFMVIYNGFTK